MTFATIACACAAVMALSTPAFAQTQDPVTPPAAGARQGAPISAGQIQRWFDAYTVLQAQDALALDEAQYGRFVTRLKALQEVRRRHHQARNRILGEIRKLVNAPGAVLDEPSVAGRLRALREEDDRAAAEVRKAYDAVDETLDIRQQARFRIFEERMEQQKLDLLLRARQNARAQRGRGKS